MAAKGKKNHGSMRKGHSRQMGNSKGSIGAKRRSNSGSGKPTTDKTRGMIGKDASNGRTRSKTSNAG